MKASIAGELLLLVGLLAIAYLLWVQQGQLVELELELDRVSGGLGGSVGSTVPPVPVASDNGADPVMPKPSSDRPGARPRRRKAAPDA